MFALTHATLMDAHRPTGDDGEIFDAHVLACLLATALEEAATGEASLAAATGLDAATLRAVFDHWFPRAERGGFPLDGAGTPTPEMEEEMLRDLLLAHRAGRGREGMGLVNHRGGVDREAFVSIHAAKETTRSAEEANAGAISSSPPSRGREREGGLGASACANFPNETIAAAPHLPTLLATLIARRAMKPDHLWQDLGLFDRSELNRLLARHFPTHHAGNTANMKWKKYFYRKLCEAEGFVLCTAPSCSVCGDFAACFGAEDGESRMAKTRLAVDRAAAE